MKLSDEQREKYYNVFLALGIYTLLSNFIFFAGYKMGYHEKQKCACQSYPKFPNLAQIITSILFFVIGLGIKNKWDEEWKFAIWWYPVLIILFILLLFNIIPWFSNLLLPKKPPKPGKTSMSTPTEFEGEQYYDA